MAELIIHRRIFALLSCSSLCSINLISIKHQGTFWPNWKLNSKRFICKEFRQRVFVTWNVVVSRSDSVHNRGHSHGKRTFCHDAANITSTITNSNCFSKSPLPRKLYIIYQQFRDQILPLKNQWSSIGHSSLLTTASSLPLRPVLWQSSVLPNHHLIYTVSSPMNYIKLQRIIISATLTLTCILIPILPALKPSANVSRPTGFTTTGRTSVRKNLTTRHDKHVDDNAGNIFYYGSSEPPDGHVQPCIFDQGDDNSPPLKSKLSCEHETPIRRWYFT